MTPTNPPPQNPPQRILRINDVCASLRLSKSTVRRYYSSGEPSYDPSFPRPVKLGKRSIGWHEEAIDRWIQSRESI